MGLKRFILITIGLTIFVISSYEETKVEITKYNTTFNVNENGETYGTYLINDGETIEPDLIAAQGKDEIEGYVKKKDLYDEENQPNTPKEAVQYSLKKKMKGDRFIPLYDKDGVTIIGSYQVN
ncbi:hypothetical protein [Clostridium sp.]|uniref:hypothetical protein n=1 Tax=Clostridium sp. TaxID=1506 RepID=UPI003F3C1DAF